MTIKNSLKRRKKNRELLALQIMKRKKKLKEAINYQRKK